MYIASMILNMSPIITSPFRVDFSRQCWVANIMSEKRWDEM
nr:MAG TPA: hypothetical protein [Caudoviricetes sp.]